MRQIFFTTDSYVQKGAYSVLATFEAYLYASRVSLIQERTARNDTIKNPLQLFLLEPKLILAAKIRPVCTSAPRPSYNSYSITISFGLFDLAHYYTVLYKIMKSANSANGIFHPWGWPMGLFDWWGAYSVFMFFENYYFILAFSNGDIFPFEHSQCVLAS